MRNILHITPDQMRHDALGCKGVFPVRTPNLDALVASGVMFDRAYCTNPLCVPSRTSLMTGRFCHDHGVYYNSQPIPEGMKTLPGILAANGYYTVAVGKMHFVPKGAHYGFHKRMGDSLHYKEYLALRGLAESRSAVNPDETDPIRRHYLCKPSTLPMEHYMPCRRAACAMDELERIALTRQATLGGSEPFYMWLSFSKPHSPCDQPEPYFSMYDPKDLPPPVQDSEGTRNAPASLKRWSAYWASFTDEEKRQIRAQYLGSVSLVDHLIGQVIDKLRELDLFDNTLIVLDSDHGDHLGDHGLQQKGFFFESAVRTPFVFAGPGVHADKVVKENVSLADVVPTILDYCDLRLPEYPDPEGNPLYPPFPPDAISLLPVLKGEGELDPDRPILSESGIHDLHIMLLKGRRKLNYYHGDGRFELYELDDDPDELADRGRDLNRDSLPAEFGAHFHERLSRALAHKDRVYWHEKVRKMFT